MNLQNIINANSYESNFEICQGCDNHCTVKAFKFQNGNTFYSGNNCEKVYSNAADKTKKGVNMFTDKIRLLFSKPQVEPLVKFDKPLVIGIPRALGIYENFPFWNTLFTACGFKVQLSQVSTNKLYEKGVRTIMADNVCFPAKLMHGHVFDLIERHVDRIFYPYVVYERKEDKTSQNSYNCPIVAGYSDVIRSSINPEKNYKIPFDSPIITFNDTDLLYKSCYAYLETLGVKKAVAEQAIKWAVEAQDRYLQTLTDRGMQVLEQAQKDNRMVIMLAARPYHIDPLIEHKVSQAIADMGIDVITENVASVEGNGVYQNLNAVTQWAYPNRIFKAAYFVGKHTYNRLHYVELTSFGCGPDAFILDEVSAILQRFEKNLTALKIDDVNNIGSLRLRIRSLVESVAMQEERQRKEHTYRTTAKFTEAERHRKLLAPYFADGYSEFLPSLLKVAGYDLEVLPMGNQNDAETGLRYANNDVCYPATIVIGSIMNALNSGKYNLDEVAIIMTQTGGQCRASNYLSLIKNAMVQAGYERVPVISLALGGNIANEQPGFKIPWKRSFKILIHGIFYADCLAKLYYAAVAREKQKGEAQRLRDKYTQAAFPVIEQRDTKGLHNLMRQAVEEFKQITDFNRQVPVVGVVGEIYVKFNGFSNKFVINWLIEQGVEVAAPAVHRMLVQKFANVKWFEQYNIKKNDTSLWVYNLVYKYFNYVLHSYENICADYPLYRPFTDIMDDAKLAKNIVSPAANFGEGWLIPAEFAVYAAEGINNVVSLQPFGCIANHVISKGIEKRTKQLYPKMNLLFLDFDSSTSDANVFNRLHFMVENAKQTINK